MRGFSERGGEIIQVDFGCCDEFSGWWSGGFLRRPGAPFATDLMARISVRTIAQPERLGAILATLRLREGKPHSNIFVKSVLSPLVEQCHWPVPAADCSLQAKLVQTDKTRSDCEDHDERMSNVLRFRRGHFSGFSAVGGRSQVGCAVTKVPSIRPHSAKVRLIVTRLRPPAERDRPSTDNSGK